MRRGTISLLLGGALGLGLAACDLDDKPSAEVSNASQAARDAMESTSATPSKSAAVQSAGRVFPSWAAEVQHYGGQEQRLLLDVAERYGPAVSYGSPEEQAQLAAMGFPSAEEWLSASRLTDAELETRARSGDAKAKAFFADRLAQRLAAQKSGSAAEGTASAAMLGIASSATVAADEAFAARPTPFTAYVYGYQRSVLQGNDNPRIAAMIMARQLGDKRVVRFASSARQQPVDGNAVVGVYSSLASLLRK